jgi:hypothetical protein
MARDGRDKRSARLAGAPAEGERRPGLRAAGLAGARIAAPIVTRRGGGIRFRLKAEWAAIVGAELAAITWPETLGRDGALKLLVAPAHALELQHRAPLVVERINLFFGRPVATRLVLLQGMLPLAPPPRRAVPRALAASEEKALDARLGDIADPELRQALGGLGRLVAQRERSD